MELDQMTTLLALSHDFNVWLVDTKAGETGYLQTDYDMDGQVTVSDFNLWLANTKAGASSKVPAPVIPP